METALWIIQGVLAGIFVLTGLTKLTQPREKMAAGPMSWAADVSDAQFRGIGALELLGAAGLILPGVLGIAGVITPLRSPMPASRPKIAQPAALTMNVPNGNPAGSHSPAACVTP